VDYYLALLEVQVVLKLKVGFLLGKQVVRLYRRRALRVTYLGFQSAG